MTESAGDVDTVRMDYRWVDLGQPCPECVLTHGHFHMRRADGTLGIAVSIAWDCPNCGAANPSHLPLCWSCRAPLLRDQSDG